MCWSSTRRNPTTRNVKWVARLGSQTYGNPTVADASVLFVSDEHLTFRTDHRLRVGDHIRVWRTRALPITTS